MAQLGSDSPLGTHFWWILYIFSFQKVCIKCFSIWKFCYHSEIYTDCSYIFCIQVWTENSRFSLWSTQTQWTDEEQRPLARTTRLQEGTHQHSSFLCLTFFVDFFIFLSIKSVVNKPWAWWVLMFMCIYTTEANWKDV